MSRKPIDQQQPSECRQAVWDFIRNRGVEPFSVNDLLYYIRLEASSVRDYLTGLVKAGYLVSTQSSTTVKPGHETIYKFINDTGVDAPRVRKDGTRVTQGQGRQQMWNSMRILKSFTAVELAFNSSTDEHSVAVSEATSYCAALCKAGYLAGRARQTYQLLPSRWTGPQSPQIQRTKQVYDPNTRQVVWFRIEGGAE